MTTASPECLRTADTSRYTVAWQLRTGHSMSRPILLGGLNGPRTRSTATWAMLTWIPVAVCLVTVACESTDTFSSAHTAGWLRHLAEALLGPIHQISWDKANFAVRKTGHFVGHGLMGLAWLRAWLVTWYPLLRRRGIRIWRAYAITMALCCTLFCATLDEVHQTFIPSRTGLVTDAWLDTSGAAVLILLTAVLFWKNKVRGKVTLD